jgi:hypothetical protein
VQTKSRFLAAFFMLEERPRNIYGLFEPKTPGKAHKYCA